MKEKVKLLSLNEMTEIARVATKKELSNYIWPPENMENLTLGSGIEDGFGIFELYFAADLPENAEVLTETKVNRRTGEVAVKVFLPRKSDV